jgi:ClpP class serine protease
MPAAPAVPAAAGKLVVGDALRQYGINAETVKEGRNADAMSPFAGFDRQQRVKVDHMIDCTYATFKQVGGLVGGRVGGQPGGWGVGRVDAGCWGAAWWLCWAWWLPSPLMLLFPSMPACSLPACLLQRVAEGRGLSEAAVARLAKGRVWTGEQALGLGLVDQLGGLEAAVQLAKQAAGLPLEEGAVRVRQVFPEAKSPLQQALKLLVKGEAAEDGSSGGGGSAAATAAAAAVTTALTLGLQLSSAEWALLEQAQAGGAISCQCLAPEAERLAAAA